MDSILAFDNIDNSFEKSKHGNSKPMEFVNAVETEGVQKSNVYVRLEINVLVKNVLQTWQIC